MNPSAVDALQQQAAAMRSTLSNLETEAATSTAKVNEWTAMHERIQDKLASAPDSITLDVGGSIFKTTKQTLLRVEGSYFHVLLESDTQNTSGGPYFLDLDPHVLKLLRTGKMELLNGLTKLERDEVNLTMKELKLAPSSLPHASHRWSDRHGPAMSLCLTGKSAESIGSVTGMNAVIARQPLVGTIQLGVESIGDEDEGDFWLGLSPATQDNMSEASNCSCICYWSDGDLWESGTLEASLLSIKDCDVLTIRRCRSHVEFQLPPGPPYSIDLDDASEKLFPFFATDKGGVRVTIRN